MRFRSLAILAALILLVPARAHAGERSWWAWLEELSGPGYFTGWMATFDYCPGDKGCVKLRQATRERPARFPKSIGFTVGRLSSGNRLRFKDVPTGPSDDDPNRATIHAWPAEVALRYRIHRSLDIGPGVGGLFFEGDNIQDRARLTLIPVSATLRPALLKSGNAGWVRGFGIDFEALYITKGFNGASFGNPSSTYKSSAQLQAMVGVSYDFGEGIGGRVKK